MLGMRALGRAAAPCGRGHPVSEELGADSVGREPAATVALLGRRVDRGAEVELVSAGVDQGQIDRGAGHVRRHVDGRHEPAGEPLQLDRTDAGVRNAMTVGPIRTAGKKA